MLDILRTHLFGVEAFFEKSLVLTYALRPEQLQPHIPECLKLDTFRDEWAFLAVAMVQTRHLRPKGFPQFMGNDFFLIGYRVFVRYESNSSNRNFRGLYILRSETDKIKMQLLGNLFTSYNYRTIDITESHLGAHTEIISQRANFRVITQDSPLDVPLPHNSPFASWKEARKFAGPMPFTFTYNRKKREVLLIEGVRQNWRPAPVNVVEHHVGFLDELGLTNAILANAFVIENIPYYWRKGRTERWLSQTL